MLRHSWSYSVLLVCMPALGLIGCGDSGDDGSSSGTGGTSTGGAGSGAGGGTGGTAGSGNTGNTAGAGAGGTGGAAGGAGGAAGGAGGSGGAAGGSGGAAGGAAVCSFQSTNIPGTECDALAEASCTNLETCNKYIFDVFVGNQTDCLFYFTQNCEDRLGKTGDQTSLAEYEACGEEFVNATCECTVGEVCGFPTTGTLNDGSDCSADVQCSSGECDGSGLETCGVCVALAGAGEDCSVLDCGPNLWCDNADMCVTQLDNGMTCAEGGECVSGICQDLVCSDPLGVGDLCSGPGAPMGAQCDFFIGLSCNPITGLCEAVTLVNPGGTCEFDVATGAVSFCKGDAYCDVDFPGPGTCITRDGVGDACDPSLGDGVFTDSTCDPGLVCNGTCQEPVAPTCP